MLIKQTVAQCLLDMTYICASLLHHLEQTSCTTMKAKEHKQSALSETFSDVGQGKKKQKHRL